MKLILLMAAFLSGTLVWAQKEDLNARDPRLQEGQLFTLKFIPKEKRLIVSLAGKKAAEFDPSQFQIFGREILASGEKRDLKLEPIGSQFRIAEPTERLKMIEVEVKDKKNPSRAEVFQVRP